MSKKYSFKRKNAFIVVTWSLSLFSSPWWCAGAWGQVCLLFPPATSQLSSSLALCLYSGLCISLSTPLLRPDDEELLDLPVNNACFRFPLALHFFMCSRYLFNTLSPIALALPPLPGFSDVSVRSCPCSLASPSLSPHLCLPCLSVWLGSICFSSAETRSMQFRSDQFSPGYQIHSINTLSGKLT